MQQLIEKLKELQYGSLASVTGRYYAMDRDKRFERNKIAYEGLVKGIGEEATIENLIKVCSKQFIAPFLKSLRSEKPCSVFQVHLIAFFLKQTVLEEMLCILIRSHFSEISARSFRGSEGVFSYGCDVFHPRVKT